MNGFKFFKNIINVFQNSNGLFKNRHIKTVTF